MNSPKDFVENIDSRLKEALNSEGERWVIEFSRLNGFPKLNNIYCSLIKKLIKSSLDPLSLKILENSLLCIFSLKQSTQAFEEVAKNESAVNNICLSLYSENEEIRIRTFGFLAGLLKEHYNVVLSSCKYVSYTYQEKYTFEGISKQLESEKKVENQILMLVFLNSLLKNSPDEMTRKRIIFNLVKSGTENSLKTIEGHVSKQQLVLNFAAKRMKRTILLNINILRGFLSKFEEIPEEESEEDSSEEFDYDEEEETDDDDEEIDCDEEEESDDEEAKEMVKKLLSEQSKKMEMEAKEVYEMELEKQTERIEKQRKSRERKHHEEEKGRRYEQDLLQKKMEKEIEMIEKKRRLAKERNRLENERIKKERARWKRGFLKASDDNDRNRETMKKLDREKEEQRVRFKKEKVALDQQLKRVMKKSRFSGFRFMGASKIVKPPTPSQSQQQQTQQQQQQQQQTSPPPSLMKGLSSSSFPQQQPSPSSLMKGITPRTFKPVHKKPPPRKPPPQQPPQQPPQSQGFGFVDLLDQSEPPTTTTTSSSSSSLGNLGKGLSQDRGRGVRSGGRGPRKPVPASSPSPTVLRSPEKREKESKEESRAEQPQEKKKKKKKKKKEKRKKKKEKKKKMIIFRTRKKKKKVMKAKKSKKKKKKKMVITPIDTLEEFDAGEVKSEESLIPTAGKRKPKEKTAVKIEKEEIDDLSRLLMNYYTEPPVPMKEKDDDEPPKAKKKDEIIAEEMKLPERRTIQRMRTTAFHYGGGEKISVIDPKAGDAILSFGETELSGDTAPTETGVAVPKKKDKKNTVTMIKECVKRMEIVRNTVDILRGSPSDAQMMGSKEGKIGTKRIIELLKVNDFNVDFALNQYFMNMPSFIDPPSSSFVVRPDSGRPEICPLCKEKKKKKGGVEEQQSQQQVSLLCFHFACRNCWRVRIHHNLMYLGVSCVDNSKCYGCDMVLSEAFVNQVSGIYEITKYRDLMIQNEMMRMYPGIEMWCEECFLPSGGEQQGKGGGEEEGLLCPSCKIGNLIENPFSPSFSKKKKKKKIEDVPAAVVQDAKRKSEIQEIEEEEETVVEEEEEEDIRTKKKEEEEEEELFYSIPVEEYNEMVKKIKSLKIFASRKIYSNKLVKDDNDDEEEEEEEDGSLDFLHDIPELKNKEIQVDDAADNSDDIKKQKMMMMMKKKKKTESTDEQQTLFSGSKLDESAKNNKFLEYRYKLQFSSTQGVENELEFRGTRDYPYHLCCGSPGSASIFSPWEGKCLQKIAYHPHPDIEFKKWATEETNTTLSIFNKDYLVCWSENGFFLMNTNWRGKREQFSINPLYLNRILETRYGGVDCLKLMTKEKKKKSGSDYYYTNVEDDFMGNLFVTVHDNHILVWDELLFVMDKSRMIDDPDPTPLVTKFMNAHTSEIRSVLFLNDHSSSTDTNSNPFQSSSGTPIIVSGGEEIKIWNLDQEKLQSTIQTSVRFLEESSLVGNGSRPSQYFFSGSALENKVCLYDLRTAKKPVVEYCFPSPPSCVYMISPTEILVGTRDGFVFANDQRSPTSYRHLWEKKLHQGRINQIIGIPRRNFDEIDRHRFFATCSDDSYIRISNFDQKGLMSQVMKEEGPVNSICLVEKRRKRFVLSQFQIGEGEMRSDRLKFLKDVRSECGLIRDGLKQIKNEALRWTEGTFELFLETSRLLVESARLISESRRIWRTQLFKIQQQFKDLFLNDVLTKNEVERVRKYVSEMEDLKVKVRKSWSFLEKKICSDKKRKKPSKTKSEQQQQQQQPTKPKQLMNQSWKRDLLDVVKKNIQKSFHRKIEIGKTTPFSYNSNNNQTSKNSSDGGRSSQNIIGGLLTSPTSPPSKQPSRSHSSSGSSSSSSSGSSSSSSSFGGSSSKKKNSNSSDSLYRFDHDENVFSMDSNCLFLGDRNGNGAIFQRRKRKLRKAIYVKIFAGVFHQGLRNGKGVEFEYTKKRKEHRVSFEGVYENGFRHGRGIEYQNDCSLEGDWSCNRLVSRFGKHDFKVIDIREISEYLKRGPIGEGGNGKIYKVKYKGETRAAKIYELPPDFRIRQRYYRIIERSLRILSKIRHSNIVRTEEMIRSGLYKNSNNSLEEEEEQEQDDDDNEEQEEQEGEGEDEIVGVHQRVERIGYMMEFMERSVHDLIKDKEKIQIEKKMDILLQTARGMKYLHENNIMHRDMKWENVLINSRFEVKITDFDTLREDESTYRLNAQHTREVGTDVYIAPEMTLTGKYDKSCDVFAFGFMIYTLIFEQVHPFVGMIHCNCKGCKRTKLSEVRNYASHIAHGLRPEIPEGDNAYLYGSFNWLISLMRMSWSGDPSHRPNFNQIVQILDENYRIARVRVRGWKRGEELLIDEMKRDHLVRAIEDRWSGCKVVKMSVLIDEDHDDVLFSPTNTATRKGSPSSSIFGDNNNLLFSNDNTSPDTNTTRSNRRSGSFYEEISSPYITRRGGVVMMKEFELKKDTHVVKALSKNLEILIDFKEVLVENIELSNDELKELVVQQKLLLKEKEEEISQMQKIVQMKEEEILLLQKKRKK